MIFDVALTATANRQAGQHLLQHFKRKNQEDLCFALWRPSTGLVRRAALIDRIVKPEHGERELHGNASFHPEYALRAIRLAQHSKSGLAFMHSHPGAGWQGLSTADIAAERDALAYPAHATGFPLVGLTSGSDGYWSARFWERDGTQMKRLSCQKVRIVAPDCYVAYYDDKLAPPPKHRAELRRTIEAWGGSQAEISRLHIGIVGLGSVGSVVAEALSRIGIEQITLIDHDTVEKHNLDRLLHASGSDIGDLKVSLAERVIRRSSTASGVQVKAIPNSIQHLSAYKAALDCDILFSCVDRPVARDVLNYIAYAHLIPVFDGGVRVFASKGRLSAAHWRARKVGAGLQCLRCSKQYTNSAVSVELEGSLDDPSYVVDSSDGASNAGQNAFPFSLSVAAMQVNMMLHDILVPWIGIQQQHYQFTTGKMLQTPGECHGSCKFPARAAKGDSVSPPYLMDMSAPKQMGNNFKAVFSRIRAWLGFSQWCARS